MFITPINQNYNPQFCKYEKTFMIIKPDAVKRNLGGRIMDEISDAGLQVLRQWDGTAPRAKMEGNYSQYRHKSFYPEWIDFMISGDIRALVVGGDDAIEKAASVKQRIRTEYAPGERRYNLLHSSDDEDAASREISNFFDELV